MKTLLIPRKANVEIAPSWTEQTLRMSHRFFPSIAKVKVGEIVTLEVQGRVKSHSESYDDPKEIEAQLVVLGADHVQKKTGTGGRGFEEMW